LTSAYNNGVSETRAYNNDNTLASINFTGAPDRQISATIGTRTKTNEAKGITGTIERLRVRLSAPAVTRRGSPCRVESRDDNNLDQPGMCHLVGDWKQCDRKRQHPITHHGPTHETAHRRAERSPHGRQGQTRAIRVRVAMLRPAATPLAMKMGLKTKADLSRTTDNDAVADVT